MAFLHASESGFFPFCVVTASSEDYSMTLTDAMAFYWKAKTIKMTSTLTLQTSFEPGGPFAYVEDSVATNPFIPLVDPFRPVAKNMSDLVCGNFIFESPDFCTVSCTFVDQDGDTVTYTPEIITRRFETSDVKINVNDLAKFNNPDTTLAEKETLRYVPSIGFELTYVSIEFGPTVDILSTPSNAPGEKKYVGGLRIKVNENTYSQDLYVRTSFGDFNEFASTGFVLIEIDTERLPK